jgi:hypothetical protein
MSTLSTIAGDSQRCPQHGSNQINHNVKERLVAGGAPNCLFSGNFLSDFILGVRLAAEEL